MSRNSACLVASSIQLIIMEEDTDATGDGTEWTDTAFGKDRTEIPICFLLVASTASPERSRMQYILVQVDYFYR